MVNILAIIFVALIIVVCSLVAIRNMVYRRRERKKSSLPLENLESLRDQEIITKEEFEALRDGSRQPQELSIESCAFSADEIMDAIDAALQPVNQLERDNGYAGDEKWAKVFGVKAPLSLSLKELTLLSMKITRPREVIDLMAEVLAMNIPIDALEVVQKQGKTFLPRYKATARMIWVQARKRLSEAISARKDIHEQRRSSDQPMSSHEVNVLLAELVSMIMKALHIPTTASGFAVILALTIAEIDFGAFSDESETD